MGVPMGHEVAIDVVLVIVAVGVGPRVELVEEKFVEVGSEMGHKSTIDFRY